MTERKSDISRHILRRVRWLYFLFLIMAVAIFGKVIWIQYGPEGEELRAKSRRITYERVSITADRGDILASDGRILATSVPTYDIRMDFAAAGLTDSVFNKGVDSLAHCLSVFFRDKSKAEYKRILSNARNNRASNRYTRISPRRVTYTEERTIRSFPILREGKNRGGYIAEAGTRRLKPHGSLAERTIGVSNESGTRIGVEGAFDEQLRGIDGTTLMQRVSGNFRIPVNDPLNIEPVNGMDVVTTINVDLQDVAETALKQQLERGNADWGTVVLMEVATGEIHAMSNLTRKGPGRYVEDYNYAIGRRLEPGSTFKLATLIALLDDAGMSLDREFDCENGRARVGARVVVDDHKESVISLRRIFEVSSNIGFAKAVNEAYGSNPGRFVDQIRKMGPGKTLGMQIPGEQEPDIKHPSDKSRWDGTSLVMMSYGYALEITPMHTLALYNAVANGGKMMRPLLVKEVQHYGETIRKFDPEVLNPSICSRRTLEQVRECLEGVVDEGTGGVLKNDYYKAAAKTGTAQIAMESGGYTTRDGGRNYLATLVGYFPADNPKYTCIVAIKTYHGPGSRNTYYGASLSGPVFRAIADRVYASNVSWHETAGQCDKTPLPPSDIKPGKTDQLKRLSSSIDLPLKIGRDIPEWGRVTVNRTEVEGTVEETVMIASVEPEEGTIPSVRGMGLKDAIYLLEQYGMSVTFSGRGRVTSQSVAAGTPVGGYRNMHLNLSP